MSKARHGKSTFFIVMMSLLICGMLAIGATYAYDWATNEKQSLASGKYNVELQSYLPKANGEGSDFQKIALYENRNESNTGLNAFPEDAFWCPGRTEIAYLRLVNNEEFVVRCTVDLDVLASTLGKELDYAVLNGNHTIGLPTNVTNWQSFLTAAEDNGKSGDLTQGKKNLLAAVEIPAKDTDNDLTNDKNFVDFALAIHMDEQAGNENKKSAVQIYFDVTTDAYYTPSTTAAEIAAGTN